ALDRRRSATVRRPGAARVATGSPRSSSCAPGGSTESRGGKGARRPGAAGYARRSVSGSEGCEHRGREARVGLPRVRSSVRWRSPGDLEEDVLEVAVVALVADLVEAAAEDRAPLFEDDDPIAERVDVLEQVRREHDCATLPADLDEDVAQFPLASRVETDHGLIEEEHRCPCQD